jgi:uncharacterized membrane protein YkoI
MKLKITNALFLTALLPTVAYAKEVPKNIISKDKATAIAIGVAPGVVKSSEVEFEKKRWVYSFDIEGADKNIHEVLVDAKNGKIVENKIESAEQEAKEAKEEQKK